MRVACQTLSPSRHTTQVSKQPRQRYGPILSIPCVPAVSLNPHIPLTWLACFNPIYCRNPPVQPCSSPQASARFGTGHQLEMIKTTETKLSTARSSNLRSLPISAVFAPNNSPIRSQRNENTTGPNSKHRSRWRHGTTRPNTCVHRRHERRNTSRANPESARNNSALQHPHFSLILLIQSIASPHNLVRGGRISIVQHGQTIFR